MNRRNAILVGASLAALSACRSGQGGEVKVDEINFQQRAELLSGFAVNLESWWQDLSFEARFDKAAQNGFTHVEFWHLSKPGRDARTLSQIANDAGVQIAQIVGDSPALAKPDVRAEFLDNCNTAIDNAQILGTDIVTLTGHQMVEGISEADALKSYQDHMAAAAELFNAAKIYAAIEPFNPFNHPGHFINGHREALRICEAINAPYLKINWDLFHMQRHEGNLITHMRRGADQICYMQLADSPDRHQPGTGEVDYAPVLREARALGYSRPIGLEFWAKDKDYDRAISDMTNLALAVAG